MVRIILISEVIVFAFASVFHFGVFTKGYEHDKARIAEGVIGIVVFAGFVLSMFIPGKLRTISIIVQGFAFFGVAIGIITIIVGIGPHTLPDLLIHGFMIILLVTGILLSVNLEK